MIALHCGRLTPETVKLIFALREARLDYETVRSDTDAYAQWQGPHRELAPLGEVRVLVTQQLVAGAPMSGVAAALGVSDRTLRRRLAADGTSYQRLLDDVRESLAVELLGTGRLRVQDVAVRLGYAEASSFILAFRRWTGRTPGRSPAAATGLR